MKNLVSLISLIIFFSACSALVDFDDKKPLKETLCDDGLDNDNDTHFDCADLDCLDSPACQINNLNNISYEICNNVEDDDGDGLVDCDDFEDCGMDPYCQVTREICDNNVDDDGDGLVDCADFDDCSDSLCNDMNDCTFDDHCAQGLCVVEVMPTWYHDGDHDNFGDPGAMLCANEQPDGYVVDGRDCCDTNARVFPSQTTFFSEPSGCPGDSQASWDYNCNGLVEKHLPNFESCAGILVQTNCPDGSGWARNVPAIPECGQSAQFVTCTWSAAVCGGTGTSSRTQSCR